MAGEPTTQADVQLDRIERLVRELKAEMTELRQRLDQHITSDEARTRLVDQFIDPAMNLDGSLQQIGEIARGNGGAIDRQTQAIHDLAALLREHDSALRLFLGHDQAREVVR